MYGEKQQNQIQVELLQLKTNYYSQVERDKKEKVIHTKQNNVNKILSNE